MSEPLVSKEKLNNKSPFLSVQVIGLVLGPIIAIALLLLGAPAEMQADQGSYDGAWITFALLILMAIWWVTEAIPIPVTALMPLIVLPMFSVASIKEASAPYMHPIVVMLIGGFIFAKAIEQWRLHERIALFVVCKTASSPATLIGGFMMASAFLSMWISNTATSIMMVPIALSVAAALGESLQDKQKDFTVALLLGIAYSCSIGGLGTPIGTPTNLIVIGYLNNNLGTQISFAQWMTFGIPLVMILLPLTWLALTKYIFRIPNISISNAQNKVEARYQALGAMTTAQKRTLIVFCTIACLWAFKGPLTEITIAGYSPLSGLTDHVTAIIAVLLCFIIPSGEKGTSSKRLLDWKVAEQIPWGVVLLFGGGMSLAQSISSTGLSAYLGGNLTLLADLPILLLILVVTTFVIMLTELTSNIATASAIMPVIGAMAIAAGIPIELMAIPVALAAGCAFMLPMATGPNAVIFATEQVSLVKMAAVGIRINIIAIITITILSYYMAPIVFS